MASEDDEDRHVMTSFNLNRTHCRTVTIKQILFINIFISSRYDISFKKNSFFVRCFRSKLFLFGGLCYFNHPRAVRLCSFIQLTTTRNVDEQLQGFSLIDRKLSDIQLSENTENLGFSYPDGRCFFGHQWKCLKILFIHLAFNQGLQVTTPRFQFDRSTNCQCTN